MVLVILILTCCLVFFLMVNRFDDQRRRLVSENAFSQAGVKVSYCNGTIAFDEEIYDVNQVKAVQMKPYQSAREYINSKEENVIIRLDDTRRPVYRIRFMTRDQAENFTLKLISALKRAGSPKTI